MLATVTVKGQVTLPKPIRDPLRIERGAKLGFTLNDDGSILVRPLARSAMSIVGVLKDASRVSRSIEEMTDAVAAGAVERHDRSRRAR